MPEIEIGGRTVSVTHPDKVLYPESGITKADLIGYYAKVADTILPYLKDRPISLKRYPDGIGKQGFFQKEAPEGTPGWVRRVTMAKEGGEVHHVVVEEAATLAWLVQIGTLEIHVGLVTADALDRPDRLIFDLDPSVEGRFGWIVDGARRLRDLLSEAGLTPYVMTTGSRGLHILCPLDRSAPYDRVRDTAHAVARRLAEARPDRFTVEHRKTKRGDRVFIDYLRNGYAQTTIVPYGVRAKPSAPVATPVGWERIGSIRPDQYDIGGVVRRLAQTADPWADVPRHAAPIDALEAAVQRRKIG